MRPLRMPRHLSLLPGRSAGIEIGERLGRLGLERVDLLADGDRVAPARKSAQFLDLGLEFGDRLFEVEISAHEIKSFPVVVF